MNKKVSPREKIDLSDTNIGDSIQVHANLLASFKATVSRYNKTAVTKLGFDYSGIGKDLYVTATAKEWVSRFKQPVS